MCIHAADVGPSVYPSAKTIAEEYVEGACITTLLLLMLLLLLLLLLLLRQPLLWVCLVCSGYAPYAEL